MLLLFRRELFYIVLHEEILNINTFSSAKSVRIVFLTSNCGGQLCYSDITNVRRQTL